MTTTQRVRPLAAALMAVMALSAIIAPGASAETVGLQEWLSQTTDAYGVPLDHYQTLPLDRGDEERPVAAMAHVLTGADGQVTRWEPKSAGSVLSGPLLGLNGIVVKSHGGADAKGFGNAIRIAVDLARSDYMSKVGDNLGKLDAVFDHAAKPAAAVGEPLQ